VGREEKMKACMVAYTFYEGDSRVRRYAETLAERGDQVDVIALRQKDQSAMEVVNGVRVFRIQRRNITERNKFTYLGKLSLFFLRSMAFLTREQWKAPYDLIHVHSVPDFEVFAAIYPKLTGSKIILDIHDIVPEFYASKFKVSQDSLTFKILVVIERMSTRFSDHVIAANHIWEKRLQERSVPAAKCTTFLNFPDIQNFGHRGRTRTDDRFILLYPGTLNYHQGLDIAIRAFGGIKDQVPNADFHIYGEGEQLAVLKSLVVELGLQERVLFKTFLPFHEIRTVIENADLGIVPKRSEGFGNEAFSTKILEFMALSVPVIVPETAIDRFYFNDSVVRFFTANNENDLGEAMLAMIKNPELRAQLVGNADEFIRKYTWDENKGTYLDLVDSLVLTPNGRPPTI
jgi:glycosyltransferase involved in cell wall biosynthesis